MESLQPAWIYSRLPTNFQTMSDPEPPPPKKTRRHKPSKKDVEDTHSKKPGKKEKIKKPPGLMGPTKAETALLHRLLGFSLDQIFVPSSRVECQKAVEEIMAAGIGGV